MKERITISLDDRLAEQVKRAAKAEFKSVSYWICEKIRGSIEIENVARKPMESVKMDVLLSKMTLLEELSDKVARIQTSHDRIIDIIDENVETPTTVSF